MTRILLIRHGSTDLMGRVLYGRMPGVHLNEEGRLQARWLASKLSEWEVKEIVSSPMERALETAQPAADVLQIGVTVDERLTEVDVGTWTGIGFEDLNSRCDWKAFNRQRSMCRPPEGESMMEVQERAWRSVAERQHTNGTVVFVTHGDVIRGLLLLAMGISMDHIHRLEISPGSISEIGLGAAYPIIRRMNQTY